MDQKKLDTLKDFLKFCKKELNIQSLPKINLVNDKSFVEQNRSFGAYDPNDGSIKVVSLNRNLADICRSLAHELTHHRQKELNMIGDASGNTGSDIENEANAMAGIIMRDYGKKNVAVYDLGDALNEEIKVALYPGKKGVDIDSTDEDIKNSPKVQIPLDKLFRNEPADKMKQPESVENIKNLAAMYKKGKKVDPILVRKKGNKFQILDGHHRFTAAKLAGLESINAIIVPNKNITPVDTDGKLLKEEIELTPRRSREERSRNYLIAIQKKIKQYIKDGSEGDLDLTNTPITSLPQDLKVGGSLWLSNTPITSLPQGLTVGGNLDLGNTKITSIPQGLTVGGDLDLRGTPIAKKYTREQIKQMVPGVKGDIYI